MLHAIKGSAGTIGAAALAKLAGTLETDAHLLDAARVKLPHMQALLASSVTQLVDEFGQPSSSVKPETNTSPIDDENWRARLTTIIELLVKQRDVYHTSALMTTHRLPDTLIMAGNYFDVKENKMKPIPPGSSIDAGTTFLLLKDGKVIFDGTVEELAASKDEYIREYFA